MFSLTLVARHNASKKTFHVDIESLPSVSELLEGMGGYLEEKYDVQFPKIPTLFNACEDPPAADDDLPPFPTVALPPVTWDRVAKHCFVLMRTKSSIENLYASTG